jgi:intracellular septation protein
MKILFDFLPIVLFFIAYKLGDIYIATITAIIASLLGVLWSRYQSGRFEKMPLITLAMVSVLGGATLLLRDDLFIKWKPTAIYCVFYLGFLSSHFIGQKPLFERLAGQAVQLPQKSWHYLNFSWAIFFAAMGFLNLYVVYNFDTDTWVNFKLFGTTGLTLLFVIVQGIYMARNSLNSLATEQNISSKEDK